MDPPVGEQNKSYSLASYCDNLESCYHGDIPVHLNVGKSLSQAIISAPQSDGYNQEITRPVPQRLGRAKVPSSRRLIPPFSTNSPVQ